MKQSRFVNLTSYCVVEYMFEPLNSLNYSTEDFILLQNDHANVHQIFNDDGSFSTTKNIRDLSVTPIGNNRYAYLDSEKYPNYTQYDDQITEYPIIGYNVVLDQVRFHFVSGFDFTDFEALVLGIRNLESDGKTNIFANILVAPETVGSLMIFNSKPLFLGNAQYDRYIDIFVPSIKNINEEYKTALVQSATFAAAITPKDSTYSGFIYNNPITLTLDECGKRSKIYTNISVQYDQFEVTEHFETVISQTNEFDTVGAYVNEAVDGDFIEFYLTFNSGFPEELISILNRRNPQDEWIIIHQISIFEQVGTDFINTARQVFFQEDRYDEPNVFRPVLKFAHEAVSISIDYLARLTNKRTGEQIIREASYVQLSPKKYGKKLTTIPLLDKPQSHKIYNKLIKKDFEASKLFLEPVLNTADSTSSLNQTMQTVIRTEYVPVFFSNNSISVANKSIVVKTSDSTEEVVFGPGKLKFIVSPFDNLIRLKIYTSSKSKVAPLDLNLNYAKYRLVFETDSGKVPIDNVKNAAQENLSTGEITFRISKKDSEAITKSTNQTVYLTAIAQDGTETLMYSCEWRAPKDQADIDSATVQAKQESDERNQLESKLSDIQKKVDKIVETANLTLANNIPNITKAQDTAVVPTVNKFGVSGAASIKTNHSNLK